MSISDLETNGSFELETKNPVSFYRSTKHNVSIFGERISDRHHSNAFSQATFIADSLKRKYKLVIIALIYFTLYIISVTIPGPNVQVVYYGGVITLISSGYVLHKISADKSCKLQNCKTFLQCCHWCCKAFFSIITYPLKDDMNPPIAIFYWRAICDIILGLRFTALHYVSNESIKNSNLYDDSQFLNTVLVSSAWLQFAEMASELWSVCAPIELYLSIKNPFQTFKSRLKYYHLFVWSTSTITAIIVGTQQSIAGVFIPGSLGLNGGVSNEYYTLKNIHDYVNNQYITTTDLQAIAGEGLFWIPADIKASYPWLFLYTEVIIIGLASIYAIYIGFLRFKSGNALTIRHRLNAIVLNFIYIQWNAIYWLILAIFFSISNFHTFAPTCTDDKEEICYGCRSDFLVRTVFFLISSKGVVNIIVWVLLTFIRKSIRENDNADFDINDAMRDEILKFAVKGIEYCVVSKDFNSLDPATDRRLDIIIEDSNSSDLSNVFKSEPWFFFKLMVGDDSLVYKIIDQSESNRQSLAMSRSSNSRFSESSVTFTKKTIVRSPTKFSIEGRSDRDKSLLPFGHQVGHHGEVEFRSTKSTQLFGSYARFFQQLFTDFNPPLFTEYEPCFFRNIRASAGIDNHYYQSFLNPLKAILDQSGGVSNALFFYSDEDRFIAKSVTTGYKDYIVKKAKIYSEYLQENPKSFICKIYGVYTLEIYSVQFHFMVS